MEGLESAQLSFWDTNVNTANKVLNRHLHVKKSTFIGGTFVPVHSWFRLTPSFGPELVRHMLAEMNTPSGAVILDPFAGAGTTLTEGKLFGYNVIGFEINPLLHFVCETSLNWSLDAENLSKILDRIEKAFIKEKEELASRALEELDFNIPPIHNVHRWWRSDVLKDLLLLLKNIRKLSPSTETKRFFELALCGVLVPNLTNVTLGRLQLHFINRDHHEIRVWETFNNHVLRMIKDIEGLSKRNGFGCSKVYLTDSTNLKEKKSLPPVDRVITSPPYPNRYSYIWNTRPHLFMLGLISTGKEACNIDLKTIGGTWGSATSSLSKGIVQPKYQVVEDIIEPIANEIRKIDNLMANYLMKYFNQLTDQIVSQDSLLAKGAQLAYVVGCSRLKGIYIETDLLLSKIFEGLQKGYHLKKIERFRKRHSDKDLHESIVFIEKKKL